MYSEGVRLQSLFNWDSVDSRGNFIPSPRYRQESWGVTSLFFEWWWLKLCLWLERKMNAPKVWWMIAGRVGSILRLCSQAWVFPICCRQLQETIGPMERANRLTWENFGRLKHKACGGVLDLPQGSDGSRSYCISPVVAVDQNLEPESVTAGYRDRGAKSVLLRFITITDGNKPFFFFCLKKKRSIKNIHHIKDRKLKDRGCSSSMVMSFIYIDWLL